MSFAKVSLKVLLIVLINIQVKAQDQVRIDLQNMHHHIGEIIDVPVHFSTSGLRVGAYSFIINFDDTVIKPLSCQGVSPWSVSYNLQSDFVIVAGMNTSGQDTDFIGAILQFEVVGIAGQLSFLDITLTDLSDTNGDLLSYDYTNGQIAINCTDDLAIVSPDFDTIYKGIYRANQTLNSNSKIDQSVTTVEFRAGESVILDHNFEVTMGSAFQAFIQDCYDLSVSDFRTLENSSDLNTTTYKALAKSHDSTHGIKLGNAIEIE